MNYRLLIPTGQDSAVYLQRPAQASGTMVSSRYGYSVHHCSFDADCFQWHEQESIDMTRQEEAFVISLYPNPATADNANLKVSTGVDEPVEIRLIDQLGREHYQGAFDAATLNDNQRLPVATLPEGIYIVWVSQGNRQLKHRLVIRR